MDILLALFGALLIVAGLDSHDRVTNPTLAVIIGAVFCLIGVYLWWRD